MALPSNSTTKGMTLIEMLVVIAIISTAGIALSGAIQYFYRSNAFLLEQTSALDNARRGVREAVVAIRESSYGDDGSYPIETAATSSLTFYSDYDKDASVEKEKYVLQGGTLYRVVTNSAGSPPVYTGQPLSTTTIATYVTNNAATPLFSYFDANGTQLSATSTDESSIASVSITLMVDLNPTRAPNVFTLTERATLRNLRVTE
jgi:prepilin-type N-terminal cleavage/methylation domain-containing protein